MSSGGKRDKDGSSRSNSKSSQQGGAGTPARNRDGPASASRSDEPRERDNSLNRRTPQRRNPSKDETSDGSFPRKSSPTPTTANSPNEAPSRSRGSPTASTSGSARASSSDAWTVRAQRNVNHGGREQPSTNAQPNRSPSSALSSRDRDPYLIENRARSSSNNSSAGSVHSTTPTGPGAGAGSSSNKSGQGTRAMASRGAASSASPVSSSASVARHDQLQSERPRRGSGASGASQGSLYDPVPPGGVAVGTHHRDGSYVYRGTISPTTSSVSAKSGRGSGSSSPGSRSRDGFCEEPDDEESKYKTELCHTWMENRTCAYGTGCAYAHGLEELRPRPRIETFKSTPCTDPARQNYHKCDYGARCNYVHPGEAVRRAFGDRKYLDSVYFEALDRDFPYNKFPFGIYI